MTQNNSTELKIAWIGSALVDWWCPQEFRCPKGIPTWAQQDDDHATARQRANTVP